VAYTHTPPSLLQAPIQDIGPGFSVEHRGYAHRVAAVRDVGDGLYRVYVKVYHPDDADQFQRFYDVCRSDTKVATS